MDGEPSPSLIMINAYTSTGIQKKTEYATLLVFKDTAPDHEFQQPTRRLLIGASFSTLAICCCFLARCPVDAGGPVDSSPYMRGHEGYGTDPAFRLEVNQFS